jgi:hypothetical protein
MSLCATALSRLGPEATPVVGDEQVRGGIRDADLDRDVARLGVGEHVADGLLGDAVDERLRVEVEAVAPVDAQLDLRAAGGERADEIAERRLETRGRKRRWVEVDEQRAQVTNRPAQAVDHRPDDRSVAVRSARLRVVGHRSQRERQARQVLNGPVVEVLPQPDGAPAVTT